MKKIKSELNNSIIKEKLIERNQMEYYSTLLFVIITSITPGPNNISSFTFSLTYGYKKVLKYILGIVTGTFLLLFLSGLLIDTISIYIEGVEHILRYIAAAYITYLAIKSLNIKVSIEPKTKNLPTYLHGVLLQLVNPKAIFYSITLYSSFLIAITSNKFYIFLSALILSGVTMLCVSAWAISGGLLLRYLRNERLIKVIGVMLAIVLILFAIRILGFI